MRVRGHAWSWSRGVSRTKKIKSWGLDVGLEKVLFAPVNRTSFLCKTSVVKKSYQAELDVGRVRPWVRSGRVGSGWVR